MFSGIRIIPRDEVLDDSSEGEKEKSEGGKDRRRNKEVYREEGRGEGSKRDGKKISKGGDGETEGRGEGSKRDGKKIAKGGDGETIDDLPEGDIVRKSIGLDWMLPPTQKTDRNSTLDVEEQLEESTPEEVTKVNPRELNPYLKGNGSGYPEEESEKRHGKDHLLSTSVVGDGGASWR